nr:uncharacterized protein LOC118680538 [Bactrocera oleae]
MYEHRPNSCYNWHPIRYLKLLKSNIQKVNVDLVMKTQRKFHDSSKNCGFIAAIKETASLNYVKIRVQKFKRPVAIMIQKRPFLNLKDHGKNSLQYAIKTPVFYEWLQCKNTEK